MLREQLDADNRNRLEGLTLSERIAICTAAGQQQLELYAEHHGVPVDEARRILERNKQIGRTPCSSLDAP